MNKWGDGNGWIDVDGWIDIHGWTDVMGRCECEEVDKSNRWTDGTGGQMYTGRQTEQMDRWEVWDLAKPRLLLGESVLKGWVSEANPAP